MPYIAYCYEIVTAMAHFIPALLSWIFLNLIFIYFTFFFFNLINLFIFGCVGSSFLCEGPLQLRQAGATLHRGARAPHCRGLSHCGAQAPDAQAQQLWPTGPVAPQHMGSSQTRARTRVPRIGRQTLNHCATREAPFILYHPLHCICQGALYCSFLNYKEFDYVCYIIFFKVEERKKIYIMQVFPLLILSINLCP